MGDTTQIAVPAEITDLIEARIEHNSFELPLLPEVAIRVAKLCSAADSDSAELSKVLHEDQAFAGHVLRVANSPLMIWDRQEGYCGTSDVECGGRAKRRHRFGLPVGITRHVLLSTRSTRAGYATALRALRNLLMGKPERCRLPQAGSATAVHIGGVTTALTTRAQANPFNRSTLCKAVGARLEFRHAFVSRFEFVGVPHV